MDYQEQLKDKRWLLRRLDILKRDRFTCQICGYFGERVIVHHLKYTGMAWEAADEDLTTICIGCHRKIHWDQITIPKDLKKPIAGWLKDLLTPGS